jgi:hypothetical protein
VWAEDRGSRGQEADSTEAQAGEWAVRGGEPGAWVTGAVDRRQKVKLHSQRLDRQRQVDQPLPMIRGAGHKLGSMGRMEMYCRGAGWQRVSSNPVLTDSAQACCDSAQTFADSAQTFADSAQIFADIAQTFSDSTQDASHQHKAGMTHIC